MADKKQWKDLGAVTCWDTDNKGAKRKDKNGKPFSSGAGVLTLAGANVRVYVRIVPGGRPGSTVVSISMPPDNEVS